MRRVIQLQTPTARWRNHFSQLVNACDVNNVRQTEIHTAEPFVPELSILRMGWLLKGKNTEIIEYLSNSNRIH